MLFKMLNVFLQRIVDARSDPRPGLVLTLFWMFTSETVPFVLR